MNEALDVSPSPGILFNLRLVEKVDRPGAELILKTAGRSQKRALLGKNLSSYYVSKRMNPNETLPIFEKDSETIQYFGEEFALSNTDVILLQEKRQFPRIKTALPLEIELKNENEDYLFEVMVLNLSEKGLFGRFLDSKTEELTRRILDPFDLKMLNLKLKMENQIVEMNGKAIRLQKKEAEDGAIAVEFYNLQQESQEKLRRFIGSSGVS